MIRSFCRAVPCRIGTSHGTRLTFWLVVDLRLQIRVKTAHCPGVGSAFLWGLVAASSLVVGGLIASWMSVGKRTLGLIMGFGAGVLISAVAY